MCAPCKVIINSENQHAAEIGSLIRELLLNPPVNQPEDEDFLFELAEREVEYILGARRSAVDFAKKVKADVRWVKLMERLVGGDYDADVAPDSPAAV